MKALELTGQKFGHLTVIKRVENAKNNHSHWLCKCSCANEIICVGSQLLRNHYKSCGCRHGLTLQEYIKSKVKITEDGKWLWKGSLDKNGYGQANWNTNSWKAHRLSYTAFKEEIPPSLLVCHKNDCPQDVNPDNLFLSDNAGNMRDMVLKGRQGRGEKNNKAKLKNQDVIDIKKRVHEGEPPLLLAEEYKISHVTIYAIISNKIWTHIACPSGFSKYKKHPRKLLICDVIEIKKMLYNEIKSICIARKFNVSQALISRIKHGTAWKHLTYPTEESQ